MVLRHILAARSAQGEIFLFDETDNFVASFKNGAWCAKQLFRFSELDDNFRPIEEDSEILQLINEARRALSNSV